MTTGTEKTPASPAARMQGLAFVSRDAEYSAETRPLSLGVFLRLFAYSRACAGKRNWLLAMVIIRAIQLPLLAWTLGAVINGPITGGRSRGIVIGSLAYLTAALVTQFTMHFRQRLALELGEIVVHDLRRDMFRKILDLPMTFFHRTRTGRIINRFTSDAEGVRVGVQSVLFVTMVNAGQMLIAAAIMCAYDWGLFLVILGMAPVLWLLNQVFRQRLSRAYRALQESFSRVTATVAESVQGVRVTQGFGRQDINATMFRDLVRDHSGYNLRATEVESLFLPLMDVNSQLFLAAMLVIGGWRILRPFSTVDVPSLIQFFFLSGVFFAPIQALALQYNQALTAMTGAERVFRFLDTKPDWIETPEAREVPDVRGHVEFRNVDFSYLAGRPVLHDVSFTALPGQTVALVGPTGSGKSTIINLAAKFYMPTAGEILIDGVNTAGLRGQALRRHFGIVLQVNFLFTGSILDNIRLGKPDASEDDIRAAATMLGCLDVLEALPDGLHTRVGEQGAGISLGQRQIVCFVRAMLADPRILILDEATSSVDAITEARLQAALQRLLEGRTSFVVAHRLSTIRNAHQVLVLDGGRIVERGTHRQLLRHGGLYARLYRQFMIAHDF